MNVKKNYILLSIVFICGMASVATEMLASRLLAPFFGTSMYIWAILIGFILIYLSIGYIIGGRLADRYPQPGLLYQLIAAAGLFMAIIPFISRPVLSFALTAFANISIGASVSSLTGVLLLFSVPVTLLAMVSPYAIRLQMDEVKGSGNTSGSIYALSTIGSILGTFIPVFFLIPNFGTARSFFGFAVILLIAATIGLLADRNRRAVVTGAVGIGIVCLAIFYSASGLFNTIKDSPWSGASVVYEGESAYNYIQVIKTVQTDGSSSYGLILNEGHAIHSIYNSQHNLTDGEWDFFLMANYVLPDWKASEYHHVAIIGSAAGTVPKEFYHLIGPQVSVDEAEIDPQIVDVGRRYFNMNEDPNTHIHIADGRYWLTTNNDKFDTICIDAYRQPYIPFHLTTKEWFQIAKQHLTRRGVVVINAGRTHDDYTLVDVVANSMRANFAHVYLFDVPNNHGSIGNTIVIGTDIPDGVANFRQNTALFNKSNQGLPLTDQQVTDLSLTSKRSNSAEANLHEWTAYNAATVFTDDHAPIEQVIDDLIIKYVTESN